MGIPCSECGQENREGSRFCLSCGARLDAGGDGDPLIGRLVQDRYRVGEVLGEGGMGRVYLAEQQMGTASRRVAIKVLHASHCRDETLRRRFYRECEVVIQLTHPNTIQFHDFGELDDGRLFIVMELIDGRSLAQELRAVGAMAAGRVEHLLEQIAGSLHEAHDGGVVHRDLKPENILLTARGGDPDFAKVCDFGIAKRAEGADASQLTMQGTVVGTPQYMSPEQLLGAEVDARSDIYSLGLIVYEMLAGQSPFDASNAMEWAARHTSEEPTPIEAHEATRALAPHRRGAVMACLAKRPGQRPRSARAFAAAFAGREQAATPSSSAAAAGTVDVTAATLHASPVTRPRHEPDVDVLRPAGVRGGRSLLLGAIAVAALGAAGFAAWSHLTPAPAAIDGAPDAGLAEPDDALSEPDAGPAGPSDWLRIVHFQRNIGDAARALGVPDQQYAIVRPRGTITLELAADSLVETDGAPGPDLLIRVDDERSGPYRADVGVERNRFTTVGSELVGSLPLDADQFEIRRIRYVRIKNRGRSNLYLDAVGAYHTAPR